MHFLHSGFQTGEVSPLLDGRADLDALRYACRRVRNMIPQKLGGVFQRPGFLFTGRTDDQNPDRAVRLIPFVFNTDTTYRIELGHRYMRFWHGQSLCEKDDAPLKLVTPWTRDEIFEVQFAQANDVLWLTHRNHWPRRLVRKSVDAWEIAELPVIFPPLRDENAEQITLKMVTEASGVFLEASADVLKLEDEDGYYGLNHRRNLPFADLDLGKGSSTASAMLALTADPVVGSTVEIGLQSPYKTYKWVANTTAAKPYEVSVGTNKKTAVANLAGAINAVTATGVEFGPGTPAHPDVKAEDGGAFDAATAAEAFLTCTDNGLTEGDPDQVTIDGRVYLFFGAGATFNKGGMVLKGNTIAESLQNLIHAINLTPGLAGINYGWNTLPHLTVAADPTVSGNSIRVHALTTGVAGNLIKISVQNTSRLLWGGAATLLNGSATGTHKLRITARKAGREGNDIHVGTSADGAGKWVPAHNLDGGVSLGYEEDPYTSGRVRVNGNWEVVTYGRWTGTLILEQLRLASATPALEEWEAVRTFSSRNDVNTNTRGETEGEKIMRLRYQGTGVEADEATPRATLTALDVVIRGLFKVTDFETPRRVAVTVVRPPESGAPTYDWAEGAWSRRRGFPSAVTLHQQRLVFGRDNTLWGSQVSGFDNFERTELEDSSFAYDIAASQSNPIVGLASQRALIILTEGEEWLMDGGPQSAAITAAQVRAERRSSYGSASVGAALAGGSVFFVQNGGSMLNEYVFDFQQDGYEAVDLTELAEHLGQERFVQLAWAPNPHSVLWAVTAEGSLLSMSFRRKAGVIAWAKHTTPHGVFESVCTTPGPGGITDVWVTVFREMGDNKVRTVERFDPTHWTRVQDDDTTQLCCADGAVRWNYLSPATTFAGFDHLNGATVGILADGMVHAPRQVVNGTITLDKPAKRVVAGLMPVAELQPMLMEVGLPDGTSTGRRFRVSQIDARLWQTGACRYADSEAASAHSWEVSFRRASDDTAAPTPLFTGLRRLDLSGGFQDATRVILKNENMLPLHVLALVWEVGVYGG